MSKFVGGAKITKQSLLNFVGTINSQILNNPKLFGINEFSIHDPRYPDEFYKYAFCTNNSSEHFIIVSSAHQLKAFSFNEKNSLIDLGVCSYHQPAASNLVHIDTVFTNPSFLRQGIASVMIDYIETNSHLSGFKTIKLVSLNDLSCVKDYVENHSENLISVFDYYMQKQGNVNNVNINKIFYNTKGFTVDEPVLKTLTNPNHLPMIKTNLQLKPCFAFDAFTLLKPANTNDFELAPKTNMASTQQPNNISNLPENLSYYLTVFANPLIKE